jgi:hypothetical protein
MTKPGTELHPYWPPGQPAAHDPLCCCFVRMTKAKNQIRKRKILQKPWFKLNFLFHSKGRLLFMKTFENFLFFDNQYWREWSTPSENIAKKLNSNVISRIEKLNSLDLRLYSYAVSLFFKRLELFNIPVIYNYSY